MVYLVWDQVSEAKEEATIQLFVDGLVDKSVSVFLPAPPSISSLYTYVRAALGGRTKFSLVLNGHELQGCGPSDLVPGAIIRVALSLTGGAGEQVTPASDVATPDQGSQVALGGVQGRKALEAHARYVALADLLFRFEGGRTARLIRNLKWNHTHHFEWGKGDHPSVALVNSRLRLLLPPTAGDMLKYLKILEQALQINGGIMLEHKMEEIDL